MNIKDLPTHERPREKLMQKGVENLKDTELLAILLRTGRKGHNVLEIAESIITKYSMNSLLQLRYEHIVRVPGIDASKACTLLASFELAKRALNALETNLPIINSPQKVIDQISDIRTHRKEYFVILYLNARNQLIHKETVSIGILNSSIVHPREVFEPAIRFCAAQIILSHNHPSGDPTPSDDDVRITSRLVEVGQLMGIEVVDHVIITQKHYRSLKEEGYMS